MAAWWNIPGPGDEATWPPYYGHPNDPREPLVFDDEVEGESDENRD